MHGGSREGAGRKQGFAAKSAEEARRYISQAVMADIAPLTEVLLSKAKNGDLKALQILLDRAWGRSRQEIQFTHKESEPVVSERIRELARKLNFEIHPSQ